MVQLSAFASFIVRGVSHKSEAQALMKSPSKELTVKVVLSNFFSFNFCFFKEPLSGFWTSAWASETFLSCCSVFI